MKMKVSTLLVISTALLGATILVSCSRSKPTTEPTETNSGGQTSVAPSGKAVEKLHRALVRFLNADPDGGRYDLWFGDSRSYTNVRYERLTPYDELPATIGEFRLRPSGWDDTEPLVVKAGSLGSGSRYTVVALRDADGNIALDVISDNLALPVYDKAKVRVINAAPNVGEVDVTYNGSKKNLFNGVHVDAATDYKVVDAVTSALEVRKGGQDQAVLIRPNVSLDAGKMYTIVIVRGTGNRPLEAIPIEDELTEAVSLGG